MTRYSRRRALAAAFAGVPAFAISQMAMADSYNWLGGSPGNNWADPANWSLISGSGTFPNSLTDTANFTSSSGGPGTINLNGTIQLQNLTFTAPTNNYNIGSNAADVLSFAAGGSLTQAGGVGQTVSANIQLGGAVTVMAQPTTGNVFDLKGPITGTGGSITYNGGTSGVGIYQLDGANTYDSNTSVVGTNIFAIGSSTQYDGSGNIISGPFGTGTFNQNSSTVASHSYFVAVNGDQTIGNPLSIGSGQGNLVVTNAASAANLTFAGPIVNGNNRRIWYDLYAQGQTLTFGTNGTAATFTLSSGSGNNVTQINLAGTTGGSVTTLVLNYKIVDPGAIGSGAGIQFNNTGVGVGNSSNGAGTGGYNAYIVQLNGASTYSGSPGNGIGTTLTGVNGTYQLGVSSVGGIGTNATSGPFGIATIKLNSGSTTFQPHGGDRVVNNAMNLTSSGFFVSNDSSGTFNMTFAGPVTSNSGRTISNSLANNATLYFGTAGNSQVWQIGTGTGSAAMQYRNNNGSLAATYLYDVLTNGPSNVASVNLNTNGSTNTVDGPVYLMANNTYTGGTTVFGPGTGPSALGLGGTLAGTGTVGVGGIVTLSGTSAGGQGGVLAPGSAVATAGTLHVPGMQWNPFGRYAFDYNGNDPTVGSGVNDLIAGAGTLDLTNLGGTNQMDLNLNALVANSGATETYTIASFAGGVFSGGTSLASMDITNDFTFSGTTGITPDVTVTPDGTGVQLTIVQGVPEPSSLLLVAGGAGLLSIRSRRRRVRRI